MTGCCWTSLSPPFIATPPKRTLNSAETPYRMLRHRRHSLLLLNRYWSHRPSVHAHQNHQHLLDHGVGNGCFQYCIDEISSIQAVGVHRTRVKVAVESLLHIPKRDKSITVQCPVFWDCFCIQCDLLEPDSLLVGDVGEIIGITRFQLTAVITKIKSIHFLIIFIQPTITNTTWCT